MSIAVRIRRRRRFMGGGGGGAAADIVRRRLAGGQAQGNSIAWLWGEVVKAVGDTIRMGGGGLV